MCITIKEDKKVTIKTTQKCLTCKQKNEKGATMQKLVSVIDGGIVSSYLCVVCNEFFTNNKSGKGVKSEAYKQFKEDYLKENE